MAYQHVTNYVPTGHTGKFSCTSTQSGVVYTISGDLSTDADDNIVSIRGDITKPGSESGQTERVSSFSLYFNSTTEQNAIMAALTAARTIVDEDLDQN